MWACPRVAQHAVASGPGRASAAAKPLDELTARGPFSVLEAREAVDQIEREDAR
jgi:hypothetical protein